MGAGYYPWFSFHGSRFGYDPLYAHLEWDNVRRNPNWERQLRASFAERRDRPEFRPPHTHAAFQEWSRRPEIAARPGSVVARPLAEAGKMANPPVRPEPVTAQKAVEFRQHAVEARKTQAERMKWEQNIKHEAPQAGAARPPAKVAVPQSPIYNRPMTRTAPVPTP